MEGLLLPPPGHTDHKYLMIYWHSLTLLFVIKQYVPVKHFLRYKKVLFIGYLFVSSSDTMAKISSTILKKNKL